MPSTVQLTKDHVCSDHKELARINRAGGVVEDGLLNGYISMSRALGDEDLKAHRNITQYPAPGTGTYAPDLFISEPDVSQRQIVEHDVCVVVASDGIWNRLSNHDVTSIVCKALVSGKNLGDAAKAVTKRAYSKGSEDNATVVIGLLTSLPEALSRISQHPPYAKKLRKAVVDGDSSHSPKSILDFGSDQYSSIDTSMGSTLKPMSALSTVLQPLQPPETSRTDKKFRFARRKRKEMSVHAGALHGLTHRMDDRSQGDDIPAKTTSMTRRLANRIRSTHG